MLSTGGKPITLDQLQGELTAAGLNVSAGLGMIGAWVFPYDAKGQPAEFTDPATAGNVIGAHVATRPLSDEEINVAWADAASKTPPDQATMNDLLAQAHGIKSRRRVPV